VWLAFRYSVWSHVRARKWQLNYVGQNQTLKLDAHTEVQSSPTALWRTSISETHLEDSYMKHIYKLGAYIWKKALNFYHHSGCMDQVGCRTVHLTYSIYWKIIEEYYTRITGWLGTKSGIAHNDRTSDEITKSFSYDFVPLQYTTYFRFTGPETRR